MQCFTDYTFMRSNVRSAAEKSCEGFSLTEALMAMAVFGLLAVGAMEVLKNAYSNSRESQIRQDQSSLGNYFLQQTNCTATTADTSYSTSCLSDQSINIKDASGNIIAESAGRNFGRIRVTNTCNSKGEIFLTATVMDTGKSQQLLGGVPIICSPPVRPGPPKCQSFMVTRIRSAPTRCKVDITKDPDAGFVDQVFVQGSVVASGDRPSYTAEVDCRLTDNTLRGYLKNSFGDGQCEDATIPLNCTSPIRGYACTIGPTAISASFNGGGTVRDSCHRGGSNPVVPTGSMTINTSQIIGDKIYPSNPGSQDDVVVILPIGASLPSLRGAGNLPIANSGIFFQSGQRGAFDGCNNRYIYSGRSVLRSSAGNTAGIASGLGAPLWGPYSMSISGLNSRGYATGNLLRFRMWLVAQGAGHFNFGLTIPRCRCT